MTAMLKCRNVPLRTEEMQCSAESSNSSEEFNTVTPTVQFTEDTEAKTGLVTHPSAKPGFEPRQVAPESTL